MVTEMVKEIPIKDIEIVENHRVDIGKVGLQELMQSIKQHGLKQAVGVTTGKKNGKYKLIYGQRRLIACEKLGWKAIKATIETDISEEDALLAGLIENMQRVDPSFAELGRIIKRLEDENGLAAGEVAARLGINYGKIMQIKKVYEGLPEKYRKRVFFMAKGKTRYKGSKDIPAGVAVKIVNMKKDHGLSDKAIDSLVDHATKNGSSKEDLDNIGVLMRSGASVGDAIRKVDDFKVYTFSFVANAAEIAGRAAELGAFNMKAIFERVMYGEIKPITRPHFLRNDEPAKKKKTPEEKAKEKKARYSVMISALLSKVRLGEVTNGQARAIRALAKVKVGDLAATHKKQLEELYEELVKK